MSPNGLGIDRAHYIALRVPDPAAAADFAVRNMGMSLVHVDAAGRHYLAAHGLDAYSLVYTQGEAGIDHISYLVDGPDALAAAAASLEASGIAASSIEVSELWRHGRALRFPAPNGTTFELTTGVKLDLPMHWAVTKPAASPAPITFDHAIVRTTDVDGMIRFATEVMGLKESGRIVKPDGVPFLTFFRSHTIFHCLGIAASEYDGLHHYQYTLKNDRAVFEAYEQIKEQGDVELLWGPIRHGCGQNITFYFFDQARNIVEYSAEEEIILNDETYVANEWSITDMRATNEWGDELPPPAMK
jgi:catechol 2,3-dioxygenase-like lactoylglutathione lyase family enzyme